MSAEIADESHVSFDFERTVACEWDLDATLPNSRDSIDAYVASNCWETPGDLAYRSDGEGIRWHRSLYR